MARGTLIVIEGIDGAGTTTQARRLVQALADGGRPAHFTCEPSEGPIGKLLRRMLSGEHAPVDTATMALLFAADRADHLHREVVPELARGKVVVSDRYYHSSLAYQGSREDRDWIAILNARARRPDLTIWLEIEADIAHSRRQADGRPEEIFDQLDTQKRIAGRYHLVMKERKQHEHIEIIDGALPVANIAALVLAKAEQTCAAAERPAT